MAVSNRDYFLEQARHQVSVRQYGVSLGKRLAYVLEKADREEIAQLRIWLRELDENYDFHDKTLEDLIEDLAALRKKAWRDAQEQLTKELEDFYEIEAVTEKSRLSKVGLIALLLPSLKAAWETFLVNPFVGYTLEEWYDYLSVMDAARVRQAIQMSIRSGLSREALLDVLVGTRARGYSDGTFSIFRREVQSLIQTALTAVSEDAREAVWGENTQGIRYLRWTSILDSKTSVICMSRSGCGVSVDDRPLPEGVVPLQPQEARPPAHKNCRSYMTPILEGDEDIPNITYQEFLETQTEEFQDAVLGPTRAALFREGKISLGQFVMPGGKEKTLFDLASEFPEAFNQAGIDLKKYKR